MKKRSVVLVYCELVYTVGARRRPAAYLKLALRFLLYDLIGGFFVRTLTALHGDETRSTFEC
jgi:hypothetical protein